MLFASLLLIVSCKKDDDMAPTADTVVASFQFAISNTNWQEVTFSNFSQNATSYSWDFGDGETSTEKDPTHTYAAAGSYTVKLTATGDGGSSSKSETFNITDPNAAASFLAGSGSKTWYLDRVDVALGIGPNEGDNSWWGFGINTPHGDRPCILDDSYTFHSDGTWEKNTNGTLYVDATANGGWGPAEGCHDETEAGILTASTGENLSAYANGGSYTYDFDAAANIITLNGLGAYIGLAQKTDTGDDFIPRSVKTYHIFEMVEDPIADRLHISIAINGGAGGYWNFYLLSYHNPADLPDIPGSVPSAGFSFFKSGNTVDFTNTSQNATSYMWDFGDGATSSAENPTHTYSADGDYTVTLTAMDNMGQSDMASQNITISSAVFNAASLSNATGKVWKLDGEGSYYVGPGPGSSEWWGGIDAAGVIERACQMDDEFIFKNDGTFEYAAKGQVWAEPYMAGSFLCLNEADLTSPFDVFASGVHSFTATDTDITVMGLGAFIGFNKASNAGELPNDATGTPASQIKYQVLEYSNNGGVERLTITVDYSADQSNTSNWTMRLISQ